MAFHAEALLAIAQDMIEKRRDNMKKLLCVTLCVVLTLCLFTGCGKKEQAVQSFVKDYWGQTADIAIDQLQLSEDSTVTTKTDSGNISYVELTDVSLGGLHFNIRMALYQWGDEDSGLDHYLFTFTEQTDRDRLYDMIAADENYIKLQNYEGIYGIEHLSNEDAAWLTKYTPYLIGEQGLYMPLTQIIDGQLVRTTDTVIESEQLPLIWVVKKETKIEGPKWYYLEVYGDVYNYLAHKAGVEQIFPDGYPTILE